MVEQYIATAIYFKNYTLKIQRLQEINALKSLRTCTYTKIILFCVNKKRHDLIIRIIISIGKHF